MICRTPMNCLRHSSMTMWQAWLASRPWCTSHVGLSFVFEHLAYFARPRGHWIQASAGTNLVYILILNGDSNVYVISQKYVYRSQEIKSWTFYPLWNCFQRQSVQKQHFSFTSWHIPFPSINAFVNSWNIEFCLCANNLWYYIYQ